MLFKLLFSIFFLSFINIAEHFGLQIYIKKHIELKEEYSKFKENYKLLNAPEKFIRKKSKGYRYYRFAFIIIFVMFIYIIISCNFSGVKYYDMYGNQYKSREDIVFYDAEGNRYVNQKRGFVVNCDTGEDAKFNCVDSNGVLIYTGNVNDSKPSDISDKISQNSEKTNFYYWTRYVYWNGNGEMVFDDGNILIENITPETNPYEDYVQKYDGNRDLSKMLSKSLKSDTPMTH